MPRVCIKYQPYCNAGNVDTCNPWGTGSAGVYQTCQDSQYCLDSAGGALCVPDVCVSGAKGCDGERATTCAADGGGYTPTGGTVCDASSVCNELGDCAATATDTIGNSSTAIGSGSTEVFRGNQLTVRTSRQLTQIEGYVSVPDAGLVTWLVYEADSPAAQFTKIFEKGTAPSGAGTLSSSGTISVPLTAGRSYVIGFTGGPLSLVFVANPRLNTSFSNGPSVVELGWSPGSSAPATASFTPNTTNQYYERLTTAPPN
jgi:hypothetical protein